MRLLHWHGFQQRPVDMTGAAAVTAGAAVTTAVSGERVRCCRCTQHDGDDDDPPCRNDADDSASQDRKSRANSQIAPANIKGTSRIIGSSLLRVTI